MGLTRELNEHRPMIGPCVVPSYPVGTWTRTRMTDDQVRELWKIVGPTVEYCLDRMPLWRVFCSVYIEGLMHGHGVATDQ